MNKLTWHELLALADPEHHAIMTKMAAREDITGFIVFENLQMDSSQFGRRSFLLYGPSCTFKTLDAVKGQHLNDLPSRRQYPVAYWERAQSAGFPIPLIIGFNDVAANRPINSAYERAPEGDQRNYEIGRALAATVRRVQGRVSLWPRQMHWNDMRVLGWITPAAHEACVAEHDWHVKEARDARDD